MLMSMSLCKQTLSEIDTLRLQIYPRTWPGHQLNKLVHIIVMARKHMHIIIDTSIAWARDL